MYCQKCGAQLSVKAKYCPNCGLKVSSLHDDTSPASDDATSHNPKSTGEKHSLIRWILIILALALLFVIFDAASYNVYSYSTISYKSVDYHISKQQKEQLELLFHDGHLFYSNGDYIILNLDSGMGFSLNELFSSIEEEGLNGSITTVNNYAFIEFSARFSKDNVTITYKKLPLIDRMRLYFQNII